MQFRLDIILLLESLINNEDINTEISMLGVLIRTSDDAVVLQSIHDSF